MISVVLYCRGLSIGLVAAFLAGCDGAPVVGSGSLPMSATAATQAHPKAKSGDLIYGVGGCGGTCVISYPGGKLVGSLSGGGTGACSDAAGHVFITNNTIVTEYAHGGRKPINTLSLPGGSAGGCSVDPTTQNLAVVFAGQAGDVAVFANEQGSPSLYQSMLDARYCGYDNSGNLFVDGYNGGSPALSELAQSGSAFTILSINGSLGSPPSQVQWDGRYVSYESTARRHVEIQRLSISGSTATVVHAVHLPRITDAANQSWIYAGVIVVPFGAAGGNKTADKIGVWSYPRAGKPLYKYLGFPDSPNFLAVTLSVGD